MTRARDFADVISGNFDIPAGSLTNAVAADGSITTAKLADDVFDANRSLIVNGSMAIAQRGTSASSKTVSDYLTCDRWRTEASGATYNTSQQSMSSSDLSTVPISHFLRMEVTTGNNNAGISQKIEASALRNFTSKKFTCSFYAKGTNPNGGNFVLKRFFTDGSNSGTQADTNFTVTSSWQRFEITFDYPDEGSADLTDSDACLSLSFLQPNGDTSTNAWTLDLTGVQLEVGETATPFRHESVEETLRKCQRFFFKQNTMFVHGSGYQAVSGGNGLNCPVVFPVTMRVAPTVTASSITDGGSNATMKFNFVKQQGMGVEAEPTVNNANVYVYANVKAEAELFA